MSARSDHVQTTRASCRLCLPARRICRSRRRPFGAGSSTARTQASRVGVKCATADSGIWAAIHPEDSGRGNRVYPAMRYSLDAGANQGARDERCQGRKTSVAACGPRGCDSQGGRLPRRSKPSVCCCAPWRTQLPQFQPQARWWPCNPP